MNRDYPLKDSPTAVFLQAGLCKNGAEASETIVTYRTIRILINKSRIPEEPPLEVASLPEQKRWIEEIERVMKARGRHPHLRTGSQSSILMVPIGEHQWYSSNYLQISFQNNQLRVGPGYGGDGEPLSGIPMLERLLLLIDERLTEEKHREQKREKIHRLKERAVEVQVEELAERLKLAYNLESFRNKIKLTVRFDAQNGVIVDIPFNRMQESLESLEHLLISLQELYAAGLRFKVGSVLGVREWKEPSHS